MVEVPQEDPQGYPNPAYDPSKPFPFENFPPSIRNRLLYQVLPRRTITPQYNEGSVQESCYATQDFTDIDLAPDVLAVGNKAFYSAATAAFYGRKTFTFNGPTLALWWFKRIGSNLTKVRDVRFNLGDGYVKGSLGVRVERIWYLLISWLKDHHRLSKLFIDTESWNIEAFNPAMFAQRHNVLRQLLQFRGLERVEIVPGGWVNARAAGVLEREMVLEKGQTSQEGRDYDAWITGESANDL